VRIEVAVGEHIGVVEVGTVEQRFPLKLRE